MGLIYLVTNMQNDRIYIGLTTKSLQWRRTKHYYYARRGITKSHFPKALLKYDESVFNWMTIVDMPNATISELKAKEREVITLFRTNGYTLYNDTDGGDGLSYWMGKSLSEEHKMKISITSKNRKLTKTHVEILRALHTGKIVSNETKTKMSAARTGKVNFAKTYYFVSPSGDLIEIYNLAEFCRQNNLNNSHMINVAHGKRKSHKGWTKPAKERLQKWLKT